LHKDARLAEKVGQGIEVNSLSLTLSGREVKRIGQKWRNETDLEMVRVGAVKMQK
jgi:hypothetical protein